MTKTAGKTKKYTTIAMLIACASALQLLEAPLPRFLPWLKLGLANALALFAIINISAKTGIFIAAARSLLASTVSGTLLSPMFYMSISGSVASSIMMAALYSGFKIKNINIVSISGALTNNFAQLAAVQIMFAENVSLWLYIAAMIWVSIPAGLIIAKITNELIRRTPQHAS